MPAHGFAFAPNAVLSPSSARFRRAACLRYAGQSRLEGTAGYNQVQIFAMQTAQAAATRSTNRAPRQLSVQAVDRSVRPPCREIRCKRESFESREVKVLLADLDDPE